MLMCIAVCVYAYTFYVLVSKRPLFKRSWERDTPIKENMGADALQPKKCRRQSRKKGGRMLPLWGQNVTTMGADAYHYGGRCLPLDAKKALFYAALRGWKFSVLLVLLVLLDSPPPP